MAVCCRKSRTASLLLQHLFDQIVDDVVVAAAEGGDEVGTVRASLASCRRLQGQRGKLESGDPAFGPPFQRGHIVSGPAPDFMVW